ncbi:MAG: formyltetrahydrofolate deformylase [Bacteroidota bacterium]
MIDFHILRIQCPDRKGLIASITGILFSNHLNIVVMKEFVEPVSNTFFARLEISGLLDGELVCTQLQEVLPAETKIQLLPSEKKKVVIMVTKEHHCLSDLLVRQHFGDLPVNILAVIGNYDLLKPFCEKMGVSFYHISHYGLEKPAYENKMLQLLQDLQPDYLILAKYMRILSPAFVREYPNRIINIHHSFLPAFAGASPYRQAYERGVKLIGATAHFVTNDLDEGPIITQKVRSVDHEYSVAGMVKAGNEVEKSVLSDALKLVLEDRVFVLKNRTVIFD